MLTEKTYRDLASSCHGSNIFTSLPEQLGPLWCHDYAFSSPSADIVEVKTDASGTAFTYLFDIHLERAIAAFGIPSVAKYSRDAIKSRLAQSPLQKGMGLNRGHLM